MKKKQITEISADELREHMSRQSEGSFRLVDVREKEEYGTAHIPGAQLLPLSDENMIISELSGIEKDIIFYCRSGHRSGIAADFFSESENDANEIYNLTGGITVWNGTVLPDFPRAISFNTDEHLSVMIHKAMNMEKGAFRFYQHIHDISGLAPEVIKLAEKLLPAETEHARLLFEMLIEMNGITGTFEDTFNVLEGDILEGGFSLIKALKQIENHQKDNALNYLETALILEHAAYDLYKNIADMKDSRGREIVFNTIAQAEKAHIRMIARSMGRLH